MFKSPTAGRFTRAVAFAAAAALAAGAVVSPASATTGAKQEADAKPAAKKAKKFCVNREGTGTRLVKKVCKTRAEWIAQEGFDPTSDD